MKKAVIFGAGGTGRHIYEMIKKDVEVLAFVDSDNTKWGGKLTDSKEIFSPDYLKDHPVDLIYVGSLMGLYEVPVQLKKLNLNYSYDIDKIYVLLSIKSRIMFTERFAQVASSENLKGSVAEAGVYRGEFAKEINRIFPDYKLYLFDTFEGFIDEDIAKEQKESLTFANHLKNVNIEETMSKMPHPEKIELRVGRFPETADGIKDRFLFVNLDMDLYEPTLGGLRFFYPLMVEGGVILIHDYFNKVYPNIITAVSDFEKEIGCKLHKIPIGDDISIAIVK